MKIKKIVLALAAISLAPAAFAAAYTTAEINQARTTGDSAFQETWFTGASAPTAMVYKEWAEGCAAGSESVYTSATVAGAPGSIGNFAAYVCNRGGKVSVLYHTVDGGSFNAYSPWLNGKDPVNTTMPVALKRLKKIGDDGVIVGREGLCASTGSFVKGAVTVPLYMGCTTVVGGTLTANANPALPGTAAAAGDGAIARPAGGFSDVELALWGYKLPTAIGTETTLNLLQTFGVVVTPKLYRALQVAQGIYANAAADADTTFDPAFAPNITSTQYASIVRTFGGYQSGWTKLAPTIALGTSNMTLTRRTELSGTQKASNAYFLGRPCMSDALGAMTPATTSFSKLTIPSLYASTGNVKTALNTTNASTTHPYGIGVMSLENNWRTEAAAASDYRFIKLDGAHPEAGDTTYARASTISGAYQFAMDLRAFKAANADTFGASLLTTITNNLKSPSLANCTQASLPRGLSYDKAGACAATNDSSVLRSVLTKNGKNCQKPTLN